MSILKAITNSCATIQDIRIKNTLADIAYNALVVEEFW